MKALFLSFVVGLVVGVVYGVIRVKSPAPPIVALLGLLGMVLGEQAGGWLLTRKIQATNVASAHIVAENKDQQHRSMRSGRVDAAVYAANASQFGLSGNVWTSDVALARKIARDLYTGGVFINGVTATDPRVPVGGVKNSGYGRELSHFGAHAFVNAQTVWIENS
jgi:XapX domain-containing protein